MALRNYFDLFNDVGEPAHLSQRAPEVQAKQVLGQEREEKRTIEKSKEKSRGAIRKKGGRIRRWRLNKVQKNSIGETKRNIFKNWRRSIFKELSEELSIKIIGSKESDSPRHYESKKHPDMISEVEKLKKKIQLTKKYIKSAAKSCLKFGYTKNHLGADTTLSDVPYDAVKDDDVLSI